MLTDNTKHLKIGLTFAVGALATQVIIQLTILFVGFGTMDWLSKLLIVQLIDIVPSVVWVSALLYVLYQTGAILDHLHVTKHLNPSMTAFSLFIPVYNLYRPWAGLGEVRNTLAATITRAHIPFAGVRGANAATVLLAVSTLLILSAIRGVQVEMERMASYMLDTQAAMLSSLSDIGWLLLIDSLLRIVFIFVVLWYWRTIIRLYKRVIDLRDRIQTEPHTVSAATASSSAR